MAEFNASHTLTETRERIEQMERGEKFIPVLTAIIAVFAALATLFSNHSSVTGLQARTQAGILTTKAADQYNFYESKRIKIEVNQAFIGSGLVSNPATRKRMQDRITSEDAQARDVVLKKAQSEEAGAETQLERAERSMRSYENFEVSATLFEVAIVIVSITALMRGAKPLIITGIGASVIGLGFFIAGMLIH
jgi:hypothetical protein